MVVLPALAADLAQRQVTVIVGPNVSMRAAQAATSTIPIVFISGGDPTATGGWPAGAQAEEAQGALITGRMITHRYPRYWRGVPGFESRL